MKYAIGAIVEDICFGFEYYMITKYSNEMYLLTNTRNSHDVSWASQNDLDSFYRLVVGVTAMKFQKEDRFKVIDTGLTGKIASVGDNSYVVEWDHVNYMSAYTADQVDALWEKIGSTYKRVGESVSVSVGHTCKWNDYLGLNERFKWCECGKKEYGN